MNNVKSHRLVMIMTILIVVAMLSTPIAALADSSVAAPAQAGGTTGFTQDGITVKPAGSGTLVQPKDAVGPAVYVVQLDDVPLASYRGGIEGLEATNPKALGETRLNVNSPASQAYLDYLAAQRAVAIDASEAAIGRQLTIDFEYMATFNGYASTMTPDEAAQIAALPMVNLVEREQMFYPQTDAGPEWIGAPDIWDGTMTSGLPGTYGEGIIVGVIDTGIDPWNPSFLATGDDGYTVQNPYGDGNYVGICDPNNTNPPAGVVPYDPTFPCNSKLIGVWGYTASDPNPRDGDGHGSHTSSTAAGNVVYNTHVESPTAIYTASVISGVAPHANIIMYDGCIDDGGCPGASLDAARDQALLDGVNVINYSIGSGSPSPDPWNNIEEQQWLALRDAGVFCATSAGNTGPGDATIGSPADVPWITSVGSSSHNRAFLQSLTLDDGVNPAITLNGMAMSGGYGPAPVVFAADYIIPPASADDARLCAPGAFPPGTFSGEIVVCERGTYGRVEKGQTVKDGGAGGYVLAQAAAVGGGPGSLLADPHVLPAIHIDFDSFVQLEDYIANAPGPVMGTLPGGVKTIDDSLADIMASSSSRGPNRGFFSDLIVPSVNAPGRNIWAAYHQGPAGDGDFSYNVISGTSMASPHVAGSGALMMALHPDWTPAEIQSALMTTAFDGTIDDNGVTVATPFGQGSGRVQLGYAAQAGFVMNETTANYQASDPRTGGDPRTLNLASFGNAACVSSCSWTRTLRSTQAGDVTWTASMDLPAGMTGNITPDNFVLAAGGTQEITVSVDVSALNSDEWYFGKLMLSPDTADVSDAAMPIAVQPTTGDIPEMVDITTRRDAGSQTVVGLTTVPTNDMTYEAFGLAKASQYDISLYEDPTNGDVYDNLDQVWWMTFDVPADSSRMVAEITYSDAPDVDLFWGSGDTPSAATQLGSSTSGSWQEYLTTDDPPAGTYWVLVQNWAGSADQPDDIGLALGVVGGDAGNMSIDGPTSVGALEPFDVTIYYDLADNKAGDIWYGSFTLGTSAATAGDIGTVDVNLYRIEDDVSKAASVSEAMPGETVAYTISVQPNITDVDLSYTLTDTMPAGMTYVPGSASASSGTVDVSGSTLTWNGLVGVPGATYAVSTSNDDAACTMPLANSGAYVNLEAYGLTTDPGISGDTVAYSWDPSGGDFDFFGQSQGELINFTDDGFAFFDPGSPGANPWDNTMIPDPAEPNNLMAMFWRDMEIVYDAATNSGVTLANLTSGGIPSAAIIEYDNIEDWPAGSGTYYDFEMLARYEASDSWYEYIFAYDNLNGDVAPGTVGLENVDATEGVQVYYNDIAVTDGMAICFDLVASGQEPVTITYQATVDGGVAAGTELTNNVESITDNPGSMVETTSATVMVAEGELSGTVMQTPSTNPVVMGTYIDIDVSATNSSATLD
ncbi:MAG: S8 family serine peptidase, partial [Anaerolineae bacterium]|nr:S8 family serine peptidase [Anaerolineae bacterium]